MTAQEVKVVAAERLNATKPCAVGVNRNLPCIDISEGVAQYTPKAKYVSYIYVYTDRLGLKLDFTETFPFEANSPERLTDLAYWPTNLQTNADKVAFSNMVREKYAKYGPIPDGGFCARGYPIIGSDSDRINYDDLDKTPLKFQNWFCDYPKLTFNVSWVDNTVGGINLSAGQELRQRAHELWERQRKAALPPL